MNMTESVILTPKGEDELKNRAYKLNMKKRNVLILVQQPRTVQYIMDRAVFDAKELLEEIVALAKEGFLMLGGDAGSVDASASKSAEASRPASIPFDGNVSIREDIILSEARFLMVDYCVEVFKTSSTKFVDKLSACKTVEEFTQCAKEICDVTKSSYPDYTETFQAVLKEINQSAF
ncbi:MAG: hypothetical protein C4516_00430 [Oxalobacter sp.]|nr:MAG: hypothetical protein C4516_00430 [Oxalobacter sp.]